MHIPVERFQIGERSRLDLSRRPALIPAPYSGEAGYREALDAQKARLRELQELLYVGDRYSLLIIFQAMDAAGKDGAISHVMSGVNPQGCQVFSFKHPTPVELDHDFLWRAALSLPERGRIGIFNRSYYEDVLVVRVHDGILRQQALPPELIRQPSVWHGRYRSIRDFEMHLHRNGTRIVKFFLHVSREEQKRRLIARIEDPSKNWKVNEGDFRERRFWGRYMKAYEDCLRHTSTRECPWYVVPADDKKTSRLIVAQVIVHTLASLGLSLPPLTRSRRAELRRLRAEL
jgi:PPK2 family polyphosphate:nucleotide phosphotransferase